MSKPIERTTSIAKLTGKTIIAAHLKHNSTSLLLTLAGGRTVHVMSTRPMEVHLMKKQS